MLYRKLRGDDVRGRGVGGRGKGVEVGGLFDMSIDIVWMAFVFI